MSFHSFQSGPDAKLTELRLTRSLLDIAICYAGLGLSFCLYRVSPWFLPFCWILSANRLFALSLISHEALHYNISRSKCFNDFIGRYLCALPCFISLSKYRRLHLFHHRAVGDEKWDPDFQIYSPFPVRTWEYLRAQIFDLVTLKTMKKHIDYYSEWPEFFSTYLSKTKRRQLSAQSDWISYVLFAIVLVAILIATGFWQEYLLIVLLPYVVIVQPFVLIVGALQHGSDKPLSEAVPLRSRSMIDRTWLVRLLLPLDINYHAEHHLAPQIPHYHLREFSRALRGSTTLWHQSFDECFSEIFKTSNK